MRLLSLLLGLAVLTVACASQSVQWEYTRHYTFVETQHGGETIVTYFHPTRLRSALVQAKNADAGPGWQAQYDKRKSDYSLALLKALELRQMSCEITGDEPYPEQEFIVFEYRCTGDAS